MMDNKSATKSSSASTPLDLNQKKMMHNSKTTGIVSKKSNEVTTSKINSGHQKKILTLYRMEEPTKYLRSRMK